MLDTYAQCILIWLAANAIVLGAVLGTVWLREARRLRAAR
jgi:hypothetical protein